MSAGWFDNASYLYKMKEDQVEVGKQGIVSILSNSNCNCNSIRRTLSADMSSEKWLQNNGLPVSSLKRVKSSVQLQAMGDEGPAFEEIWSSIQANNKSWGSILSNNDASAQLPPPYVHPLAKRTASSLSEKSLEICTESLGSETGSDGFEEQQEDTIEVVNIQQVAVGSSSISRVVGLGPTNKRPPTRPSFPPPLPSLGHRDDGSNVHIRSHRQDGRLVVEAVSVPSHNCFRAQRQDGRLLLTLSPTNTDEDEDDHVCLVEKNNQQADVIQEEKGVVNVQRPCTTLAMMTKFMELTNKSSTWPRNYNTSVINKDDDEHAVLEVSKSQSLPPRPTKSSTALNAYEYYWRRSSTTSVGMLKPFANTGVQNTKKTVGKHTKRNNNKLLYAAHSVKLTSLNQQQAHDVVAPTRGAAEYVVPMMLRGCKEAKKPSLLLWEPHCIATS